MREGRVLSRRSPSKPSAMKRSCQRQTQVFDVPVWRMIALVPKPSADRSTICPPDMLLRSVAVLDHGLQPSRTAGVTEHGFRCACPRLARRVSNGNPQRDSNVRFYPLGGNQAAQGRGSSGGRGAANGRVLENLREMSCWKSELVIRLKDSRPVGPSYGGYGHVAVVEARRKLQKAGACNALKTLNSAANSAPTRASSLDRHRTKSKMAPKVWEH